VHARLLHRIPLRGTVEVYAIEVDATEQASLPHLPGVAECLVVTGGGIRTGPSDAPVDLAEGDSVHFGAASPHLYRGLGLRNSAVLLMLHPEGC
jgi:mannose-6-phosphate isomerase-like protein (cupin superfamily)